MAYSEVWDNTFPPDTQAANQLGVDLRNLKTDISQRVPNSGLDANKPALENAFAGALFFATDTQKIYQLTNSGGAATAPGTWVDVTASILPAAITDYDNSTPVSSSAASGDLQVQAIPSGALQSGSYIEVLTEVGGTASTTSPSVSLVFIDSAAVSTTILGLAMNANTSWSLWMQSGIKSISLTSLFIVSFGFSLASGVGGLGLTPTSLTPATIANGLTIKTQFSSNTGGTVTGNLLHVRVRK